VAKKPLADPAPDEATTEHPEKAEKSRGDRTSELFYLDAIFPDPAAVFSFSPKPLQAVKDDALVVLDTNALLVPYRTDPASLKAIETTYRNLTEGGRLFVPAQVAREFASNRPNLLRELYQQIGTRYVSVEGTAHYPLMGELKEYKELKTIEKTLISNAESQRKAVSSLLQAVRQWNWDDPVSAMYQRLFGAEVVVTPTLDREAVVTEFERRKKNKIPPGYKDAGAGDLLIWLTVLELAESKQRDLIFVSGDEKADWWYRSEGALYPRYELVDEYRRRSGGRTLHIVRLGRLLEVMGADAAVVEDVRQQEAVAVVTPKRSPGHWGHTAEAAVYTWLSQFGTVFTDENAVLYFGPSRGQRRTLEVKLLADPNVAINKLRDSLEAARRSAGTHLVVMVAGSVNRADTCVRAMTEWLKSVTQTEPLNLLVLTGHAKHGVFEPIKMIWPRDVERTDETLWASRFSS